MSHRTLSRLAVIAAATGMAVACTTAPLPPATLAYSSQMCATTPELANAISLTAPSERRVHIVETPVTAETPCLVSAGVQAPYLVYGLPVDFGDKTLIVGGLLEGNRIFAPKVSLLDAAGVTTRTFEASEYYYRGDVYSVQFRPRSNETYVLLTTDTARVGQTYNSIITGMQSTAVPAGPVIFVVNSGTETSLNRVFSYDGKAHVTVHDTDTEEKN